QDTELLVVVRRELLKDIQTEATIIDIPSILDHPIPDINDKKEMDWNKWYLVIERMKELGVGSLSPFGGETAKFDPHRKLSGGCVGDAVEFLKHHLQIGVYPQLCCSPDNEHLSPDAALNKGSFFLGSPPEASRGHGTTRPDAGFVSVGLLATLAGATTLWALSPVIATIVLGLVVAYYLLPFKDFSISAPQSGEYQPVLQNDKPPVFLVLGERSTRRKGLARFLSENAMLDKMWWVGSLRTKERESLRYILRKTKQKRFPGCAINVVNQNPYSLEELKQIIEEEGFAISAVIFYPIRQSTERLLEQWVKQGTFVLSAHGKRNERVLQNLADHQKMLFIPYGGILAGDSGIEESTPDETAPQDGHGTARPDAGFVSVGLLATLAGGTTLWALAPVIATIVLGLVIAFYLLPFTESSTPETLPIVWAGKREKEGLRIACVQITQSDFHDFNFEADTQKMAEIVHRLKGSLGSNAPDLVVFPEDTVTRGKAQVRQRLEELGKVASETQISIGFSAALPIGPDMLPQNVYYYFIRPGEKGPQITKYAKQDSSIGIDEDRILSFNTPSGDYKILTLICAETTPEAVSEKGEEADLVFVPASIIPGYPPSEAGKFYSKLGKPTILLNEAGQKKGGSFFSSETMHSLGKDESILMVDLGAKPDEISQAVEAVRVSEKLYDHQYVKPELEELLRRFVDPETTYGKAILSKLKKLKVVNNVRNAFAWLVGDALWGIPFLVICIRLIKYLIYPALFSLSLGHVAALLAVGIITIGGAYFLITLMYFHIMQLFGSYYRPVTNTMGLSVVPDISHEFGHFIEAALKLKDRANLLGEAFETLACPEASHHKNQELFDREFKALIEARDIEGAKRKLSEFIKKREEEHIARNGIAPKYSDDDKEAGWLAGAVARQIYPNHDIEAFRFLISAFMEKDLSPIPRAAEKGHIKQARVLVKILNIDQSSTVVSVGPGSAVFHAQQSETNIIPWERLFVSQGANVLVYEPAREYTRDWQRLAHRWKGRYKGTLDVLPPEKARFEKSEIELGTADVVVMMSVLSHPRISLEDRKKIALKAVQALRPGGYLIVGWYNAALKPKAEYMRTHEALQELRDKGYRLEEIVKGSEPELENKVYGHHSTTHDWVCYEVHPPVTQKEKSVTVNGVELHCRVMGRDDAPAIVVAHGGPGFDHNYLLAAKEGEVNPFLQLAEKYRVIFYDQRASGKSGGREDISSITVDSFVDDIEGIRKAFGLEKMILVGHSWGGLLTMLYAARYGDKVKSLILLHPLPETGRILREARIKRSKQWKADGFDGKADTKPDYWERFFASYFYRRDDAVDVGRFLHHRIKDDMKALFLRLRRFSRDYDISNELSRITCPTLIISGDHDLVSPHNLGESIAISGNRNVETCEIKRCGHFSFYESPYEFFRAVNTFLEEQDKPVEGAEEKDLPDGSPYKTYKLAMDRFKGTWFTPQQVHEITGLSVRYTIRPDLNMLTYFDLVEREEEEKTQGIESGI
ncbi:MAG: alpha/beta fold hydrolase, partial [Candidatus Omnitrophota bacterium]